MMTAAWLCVSTTVIAKYGRDHDVNPQVTKKPLSLKYPSNVMGCLLVVIYLSCILGDLTK